MTSYSGMETVVLEKYESCTQLREGEIMRLRCADGIFIRRGAEGDEERIAELLTMASGDMLSFILKGVAPSADARRIYREMIS